MPTYGQRRGTQEAKIFACGLLSCCVLGLVSVTSAGSLVNRRQVFRARDPEPMAADVSALRWKGRENCSQP